MAKMRVFFGRHYAVLYVCIVGLLLAFAVFSLYEVLSLTSQPTTVTNTIGNFDQSTIQKIKALTDSDDKPSTEKLPSPRSNPFNE